MQSRHEMIYELVASCSGCAVCHRRNGRLCLRPRERLTGTDFTTLTAAAGHYYTSPTMSAVTTTECLASANELLASHNALVSRIRNSQRNYRRQLKTLPSPPAELLKLPLIPTPPHSPSPSPPSSPLATSPPRPYRPDLPPAKRARLARYNNYVPEEETIRNDYSQRYVDGGEWPQDWVLGADPDHRFEE